SVISKEKDYAPASTSSTSEEKVVSEIDIQNLTIDDSNKFLDEDSNIKIITSGDTPYRSAFTFEELNLSPPLLKGLYVEMKYQKPSKIQAISLPLILDPPYLDLIAQAHNGSGKTACFTLGMLSRVDPKLKAPQALCCCPTRELAIQNSEVLRKMGKYTGITFECAIGGDFTTETHIKKRSPITAQVVIGTPGTIKRRMTEKTLGLSYLMMLVFDEADHMLAKEGFKDDSLNMMKHIGRVTSHCQVLLFSATFNESVKKFAAKIVKGNHNELFVKKEELSLESVIQYKVDCPDELAKVMVIKDQILEFGERAVFNLLCGDMDEMIMSKIETHFEMKIAKVPDWRNEEDFKAAMRSAGL
ncbi:hypothetical protein Goklo_021954, partial [Gossypium klotzschianum]|nr:hypothetical protein [Gossypium klotzschianum]